MQLTKDELNTVYANNHLDIVYEQLKQYGAVTKRYQYVYHWFKHHNSEWRVSVQNDVVSSITQYQKDMVQYSTSTKQEPKMQYVYVLVSKDVQILGVYTDIIRASEDMNKNPSSRITQEPIVQ